MSRPKVWKQYLQMLEGRGEQPDSLLAKFAARYRFAASLEGMTLPGFSEATREGYLVATRVAYAYSALEALERGIGSFAVRDRSQIIDFRIAEKLSAGDFDSAIQQIVDAAEPRNQKGVSAGLDAMMANLESGNVRPFVEGIRNSLFHGKFTPSASGLKASKSRRDALDRLADEILLTADDLFKVWLRNQTNKS